MSADGWVGQQALLTDLPPISPPPPTSVSMPRSAGAEAAAPIPTPITASASGRASCSIACETIQKWKNLDLYHLFGDFSYNYIKFNWKHPPPPLLVCSMCFTCLGDQHVEWHDSIFNSTTITATAIIAAVLALIWILQSLHLQVVVECSVLELHYHGLKDKPNKGR